MGHRHRREPETDDKALARLIESTSSDGLFLDTMTASPAGLRAAVDAVRPGVAFEPEGHPTIEEIEHCNASWGQWLEEYPQIGVLHLKWIEPRHMQHQIRRWDKTHQAEMAAAWLNGSGVLVWENIFGYWNPWNAEDRATLRRMAPVLRCFSEHFARGRWMPYYPTATPGACVSCWEHDGVRLWTIARLHGDEKQPVAMEVDDHGESFLDLWNGEPMTARRSGQRIRLEVPVARYGAVAAFPLGPMDERLKRLLARQHAEAMRTVPRPNEDSWMRARSVAEPLAAPDREQYGVPGGFPGSRGGDSVAPRKEPGRENGTVLPDPEKLLAVEGGEFHFHLHHMRRECGCYPDLGTAATQWDRFLTGTPHDETLQHDVKVKLPALRIASKPVTNAQFDVFLKATGYRPRDGSNFLKHWSGIACPTEMRDKPVVYVDLDDAHAYAAWAKKRLPSEWEWHRAAQQHGSAFQRGEVWEWTESLRDDGRTRFVLLRGGCRWKAEGSIWYFPTGPQPIETHAKYLLLAPGLDRCGTIGFRCAD